MTAVVARARARVSRHLATYGEWWWAPIVYVAAVLWIYRDVWSVHGQPTAFGWDTIDSYGPDLSFLSREVAEGRLSLWNPYDHGGYSLVGDPQFDRYYPFMWPFAALGALTDAPWWLIQVVVLAHHVVAGCMMHLFLRSRRLPAIAAVVAGLGVVASAPLLIHKASIVLWPLVWIPLIWIAIDAVVARPGWQRGAALAGAYALCITASSPPSWFYALLATVPYALWRGAVALAAARRGGALRAEVRRLAVAVAVAAALFAMLVAIVILPARELTPLTLRGGQTGRDFALGGGLPPGQVLTALVAPIAGSLEVYLGLGVLWLAICAVAVRPRHDDGVAILWLGLGVLALVLSFGTATPVLPWLVDHVPGFALFRVAGRYKLVAVWCGAAGAGYGVAALLAVPRTWTRPRLTAIAVAALAIAATASVVAVSGSRTGRSPGAAVAVAVATALLLVAMAALPRRAAAVAAAAMALLVVHDAPFFVFRPNAPPAAEGRRTHAGEDAILARLGDVGRAWRLHDEFLFGERVGARRRVRDFRGYTGIDPLSQKRYVEILEYARRDVAVLEAYNVRWVLATPHWRSGRSISYAWPLPDRGGHFEARGGDLFEARHPAPLAAWYGAIAIVDHGAALAAVRNAEEPDGTRRVAIVERGDANVLPADIVARLARPAAGAPPSLAAALDRYEPDRIELRVDAPAEGLLVLNEVSYPGWQVTVDGVAATPVRANYLLRAVVVPAGRHAVRWEFHPTRWRLLATGYLLGLAALVAAWVTARRAARRRPGPPPTATAPGT